MMTRRVSKGWLAAVLVAAVAGLTPIAPLMAQDVIQASADAGEEVRRGPVTNLPIPRYVSLKASEANVRRGPSLTHRIDWVYKRRGMPLEVIGEFGHWRQVIDRDGVGGWVHYALLSGERTGLIEQDLSPLYSRSDDASQVIARLETGVVVTLQSCDPVWCRARVGSHRGWVHTASLWGLAPGESFE